MSEIRPTYSGLISLVVTIITVVFGVIFTIIITRTLSAEEYGIWNLLMAMVFYITVAEPIISYWVTREVARGIKSGKTAMAGSGVFSVGGIFIFILIAYLVGSGANIDLNILFFGAMIAPLTIINNTLIGINFGWKPHVPSYAYFVFSITTIPIGLFLIYYLQMGLYGVIITVTIAYISSIILLAIFAREKITGSIKNEFFKKWTKLFWLPTYPSIGHMVSNLGVILFPIITGSIAGIAYWFAAVFGSILTTHSIQIAKAAYPKLIQGDAREYIQQNLNLLLYFSIFFLGVSITFGKASLFILNPIYESVIIVLIILAFYTFFSVLSQAFQEYLKGIERVDFQISSTFMDYVKSKLFLVPTIVLAQQIIFIILFVTGLYLLSTNSEVELLIYWAIIILGTQFPTTVYFYTKVKKNFNIRLQLEIILKYTISSIVISSVTYVLAEKYLVYHENLFIFIPNLIPFMILSIVGYLVLTYLIDNNTRRLFGEIVNEIKNKY